ncbi:hypothetical protein GGI12_000133 [Dipsacomyces acuminosporus]|nr:hypothetical protein GGI12_000133 [Dipsacomyces acuminosporus]
MVIPLNRVRNATLFVPTNEALRRYRREHGQGDTSISGSVYRGVSDYQAWYHLVGDGVIAPGDLTEGTMVWESFSKPSTGMARPLFSFANGAGSDGDDSHKEHTHGVMLKTQISRRGSGVILNGVPVLASNYSCSAGNVYLIDGLLTLPPTIQELLHANVPKTGISAGQHSPFSEPEAEGHSDYDFVEKLLGAAGWSDVLSSAEKMHTLWSFSDQAFRDGFSYVERAYLLYGSKFAEEDADMRRTAIEDARMVAAGYISVDPVSLARLGEGEHTVPGFLNGTEHTVIVKLSNGGLSGKVNGLDITTPDIIARNGIVHGIEQVQRPAALSFTPQKALIGLNATMFLRVLNDNGLQDYVDGSAPDRKLTLLVPTNRAMEDAFGADFDDDDDDDDADDIGTTSSRSEHPEALGEGAFVSKVQRNRQREWALYHIVDGQNSVDDLSSSPLLRTKLASEWTLGKPQVVKAQVDQAHGASSRHVSFNGADNILPEPVVVGNTTIYLLSASMPTPPSLINALIQDLDLSLFVAAMGASRTAGEIQQESGITVLAPVVNSFTSLGLVWSYLSLPGDVDARCDLGCVVKSHILKMPVYSDEFPMHNDSAADTLTVETLNGNFVGLYRTPHGMYIIPSDPEELPQRASARLHNGLSDVSDSGSLGISESDVLLRTGVAHVLESGLILPPNVDITSSKLLRGMRAHIFADLLERFNLTYVLGEDTKSSSVFLGKSESPDSDQEVVIGYSLLVPSDKAWRENAAYRELVRRDHDELMSLDDQENPWRNSTTADIVHYLDMLVRLHVVPIVGAAQHTVARNGSASDPLPPKRLALVDRKTYPTLLENVRLRAHEFANDRFSLQLDRIPFYQSPGGVPFISFATVVRSGFARTGAVFELDSALRLPPDDSQTPGGWKRLAWNAAVWITSIGMGSGMVGASAYWIRQWWTRSDYQSL